MSTATRSSASAVASEELVLALLSVDGTMAACTDHGDAATLAALSVYYAFVADAVVAVGGRVVKVMGDGVLNAFPIDRVSNAVAACRQLQAESTAHWRAFDARCRARVVITAGPVLSGQFGPPGLEGADLFGHTLNQLFRAPAGEVVLLPSVAALL